MAAQSANVGTVQLKNLDVGFDVEMVTVDRRFAARSHINRAVRLLMIDNDLTSATVLAWAGTDLLRGIAKSKGQRTWSDQAEDFKGAHAAQQLIKTLKFHYNYLKHARDDPNLVIEKLSPDVLTLLLYGAAYDYEMIFGCLTRQMLIARLWALARMPEFEWPSSDLGLFVSEIFGNPCGKPFSEARPGAIGTFLLCEDCPEFIDEKFFANSGVRFRCDYPNLAKGDAEQLS